MNKLDLLTEEKIAISQSKSCLEEGMKYLNLMRDSGYYKRISEIKNDMTTRLNFLEKEIETTKRTFNGIVETETFSGVTIVAKRKSDGKDMFLRYVFMEERVENNNWKNAFVFDWVENLECNCFINYEEIKANGTNLTKENLQKAYSYHKKNYNLEKDVEKINLKTVSKENQTNYIFL